MPDDILDEKQNIMQIAAVFFGIEILVNLTFILGRWIFFSNPKFYFFRDKTACLNIAHSKIRETLIKIDDDKNWEIRTRGKKTQDR